MRKRRQREDETGVEGKGKSTRARVPTSRITHPAPKFSISNRRGDQPPALGRGQALAGPPHQPIIMPAYGEGDAAQALASQQAAYCMSWACLPCLTVVPSLLLRSGSHQIPTQAHHHRYITHSNPGPTPYRRPELLVLKLGSAI